MGSKAADVIMIATHLTLTMEITLDYLGVQPQRSLKMEEWKQKREGEKSEGATFCILKAEKENADTSQRSFHRKKKKSHPAPGALEDGAGDIFTSAKKNYFKVRTSWILPDNKSLLF